MGSNKTIVKNTLFLYIRMMVVTIVSLFTSKVILRTLGVDDYGLYVVVGGVVGVFSFLRTVLSTASSRFLTFELGAGDFQRLNKMFSTLLTAHIVLIIGVVILAETLGLWFIKNKAAIPLERLNAAIWVYHISVFTAIITITQIPYNAVIIAREKMNVFAYLSIVEVIFKLGIVYLLQIEIVDKLILYAILICIVTIGMALFYRFYCVINFKETYYKPTVDHNILKSVGSFSGWSLLANMIIAISNYGTTVIINMFFGPAVVTARAISEQVNMAISQFMQNFRTAANPQIIKKYAGGDREGSKAILIGSTKFSFYLMLLLGLPVIILAKPLLELWLEEVPKYTIVFVQLIIIQSLLLIFDISFFTVLQTNGRLKENTLICLMLIIIQFLSIFLLFKNGYPPVVLSYIGIIFQGITSLIVKPMLICKIASYTFNDITRVFLPCLKVCAAAIPIPLLLNFYLQKNPLNFFVVCLVSIISVVVSVFYLGIEYEMRRKIIRISKEKYHQFVQRQK